MVNTKHYNSTSVIIPASTSVEYLTESVGSLVGNAEFILEVLIVFSNFPESEAIIACDSLSVFQSSLDIKYIYDDALESNGATARNAGILKALGDYVAFLDDDDYWMADKLKCYFDFLSNVQYEEYLLFSPVIKCRRGEKGGVIGSNYRGQDISNYLFLDKGVVQTSSWLMPIVVARNVMFNPRLVRHQDYDFCLRAQKLGVSFCMFPVAKSYWVENESKNFISKGAKFEFCKKWVIEYQELITEEALIGYFAKDFFYVAYKERRVAGFWVFCVQQLGLAKAIKLIRLLWGYYAN